MASRLRPIVALAVLIFSVCMTARANEAGLAWLVKHQEADGHWNSRKYGAAKKTDTAATSLALLSLLGIGNSEKVGEYKANVQRAVAWLKSKQDASGKVFDATDAPGMRDEACASALATMALAEAAAMANTPVTKAAAQRAVDYCSEVYPIKKGPPGADGVPTFSIDATVDTPLMAWTVMALKSAKVAGLKVQHGAFDAVILYLDSVDHKVERLKDDGEIDQSEYWLRKDEHFGDGHPAYRVTAAGSLCRQFLGWKRDDLRPTVARMIERSGLPVWTKDSENVDVYYWYLATLCAFGQSNVWIGEPGDNSLWRPWSDAKNKALLDNQCKDGDDAGSWDARGYASREWGRVGQTALACLSMEIYVR
jgi:hypothetical protein